MNISLKQSGRKNFILSAIFGFLILLSSIPFISHYHYNCDSVNYGLAIHEYNISASQPHPSGYPVFVALGKIIDFVVNNTNLSLVIVSILLSIFSVIVYYYLAIYIFDDIKIAFINTLFLIFCPVFWFYRELALTYVTDLTASVITVFLVFKIIYEKKNIYLYVLAFSIGIISGFRPSILLLIAPLLMYAFIFIIINDIKQHSKFDFKKLFVSGIIFLTTISLWLIPVCISIGGLEQYLSSVSEVYYRFARFTSVLYGAPLKNNMLQIRVVNRVLICGIFGIIVPLIVTIFYLLFYYFKKNKDRIFTGELNFNHFTPVILISIIPALLFYYLVHFGQPGYILIVLPPLYLLSGIGMKLMFNNNIFKSLLIILFIIQTTLFLVLSPSARLITTYDEANGFEKFIAKQNNMLLYFTAKQIKFNDSQLEILFNEVNKFILDNNLSQDDVFVICPSLLTYKHKGDILTNDSLKRHFDYYLPKLDSINLTAMNNAAYAVHDRKDIYIKSNKKSIIVTADKINDSDLPKHLTLKKLNRIYVADLFNVNNFTFMGYNFIRR